MLRAPVWTKRKPGQPPAAAARTRIATVCRGYANALSQEEAKLDALKDQLASLVAHREPDIETKLKGAPDYSPQETGLLSRLAALDAIAHDNPKIGWTVLLIEICAFGFELASVLAVTSAPPTSYAALRARDSYVSDVATAEAIMETLNAVNATQDNGSEPATRTAPSRAKPDPAAHPASSPPEDAAASPPKRPRGRPRKNAFTIAPVGPPTQA